MTTYSTPYQPINCSFHDILLEKATFKKIQNIKYKTEDQTVKEVEDKIIDVYTKSGSEYMVLEKGLVIRLDHIISVEDNLPNDFDDCNIR